MFGRRGHCVVLLSDSFLRHDKLQCSRLSCTHTVPSGVAGPSRQDVGLRSWRDGHANCDWQSKMNFISHKKGELLLSWSHSSNRAQNVASFLPCVSGLRFFLFLVVFFSLLPSRVSLVSGSARALRLWSHETECPGGVATFPSWLFSSFLTVFSQRCSR